MAYDNSLDSAASAVLVLGGGIAGIQASLDIAALGFKVYLVDKAPMLGGKMAQLDKTFPTNDCSMCILSPKLIECERQPNIEILTYCELKSIAGKAGDFQVILYRKPRYVDENLCVGCGTCALYCPVKTVSTFNESLIDTKAIAIPHPQAVPLISVVDREKCLFLNQRKCQICFPVCQRKAIDFTQTGEEITLNVGAVIVTIGYDIFDTSLAHEYGYGRLKNIFNSLEFERILNASGPYQGEVLRPSDGKVPQNIAWLQCVGSRNDRLGHTYCSSVCCEYAIKQLILVKEHYPDVKCTIFFNDMRAYGKGFEDFYNRAHKLEGSRFIRRRISTIKERKQSKNLVISYVSDNHEVREEEFELVVLSAGLNPSRDCAAVAQILGLELNEHGFLKTNPLAPNETNRPGIFAAAACTGPMDIPDSVISSTGAVSLATQLFSSQKKILVQPRHFPKETVIKDELSVGVFICHCGANIGRVVNVPDLVEYARTLENVVHVEDNLFFCSSEANKHISTIIREKELNRVVVAACTPRTHEPLFQDTLNESGLNKYLFVMANIREHCSWVHSREKEKATEKAKDIVRMAVARARHLEPLREIELPVNKNGLVLGGGLAGMTSALGLAKQGFNVYLVEKEASLGGNLRKLHYTLDGVAIHPFLESLKKEVESHKNIRIFKNCEHKNLSGSVGSFRSIIQSNDGSSTELEHGIIIVATGGKELKPHEYRYGQSQKIVTQQEFENLLVSNHSVRDLRQVAMIQCVGARDEKRPYCGRICCGEAIKNALKVKTLNEATEVIIFYRDIRTYGFKEEYYAQARRKGVLFIRYEPERKPQLEIKGDNLSLKFYDTILNEEGTINPDLVVLSTPVVSEGNQALSQELKIPITSDGFFMEAHMKLRPMDFSTDGIFLCGLAHYPKYIPETISQANGATARAAAILSKDFIVSSGAICEVSESKCLGCGLCESACPYSAVELQEKEGLKTASVIPGLCKGCGLCNSLCPVGAIELKHFTNGQIFAEIASSFRC